MLGPEANSYEPKVTVSSFCAQHAAGKSYSARNNTDREYWHPGFAWMATTPKLFWIAANLAGICMGSSQSAGRALVAYFSPVDRAAEFFGLWGVATRLSAVLGPLTYGVVSWVSGGNHRMAMLITGIFFIAALIVLVRVDEKRGRAVVA